MTTTKTIGPYLVEKRLGLGGMAEIFLAKKPFGSTYKRVVVKRILPELSGDAKFVDMFEREAGILAQLNHANVVQIFDMGTADDGNLFIAMEFLDGLSVYDLAVKTWKTRRALPLELVLRVVAEAARGLDYVHRQGVVHRDVASDNLFFVKDGTVKLVDFGVARGVTMRQLTRRGEVKGKIPYMAPEQLEDHAVDGRADLYSLGVTAYWLLSGKRPFRADNDLALIRAILRAEPERLDALNADVPRWLADAVHRLLAKDPRDRIQKGGELESLIANHAGASIDRARDVAFVEDVCAAEELDEVTAPMPAVRRVSSNVFARVAPRPVSVLEAEAVSDDMITGDVSDGFDIATTAPDEITFPDKPRPPSQAASRMPLPRAMHVDMPLEADDPSGDTLRLTESQLGLKRK